MQTSELVTAEELERMGRRAFHFELVNGRLVRMNPSNHEHGQLAVILATALQNFARPRGLGSVLVESGYTLRRDPDTVRGPDVSFVRRGRPDYPPRHGFYAGAPDLAVEVRSPDDTMRELLAKADEYLEAGSELVWFVDPDDTVVTVLRPGSEQVTLGVSDILDGRTTIPGFSLPLAELFAPPG